MTQLLLSSPSLLSAEGVAVNYLPSEPPKGAAAAAETPALSEAAIKQLAALFKLLADETRLRILALLVEKDEMHVRALCDVLGQSQPAVSHHLALLRLAGLIECRRDGKHNFYRALPERAKGMLDTIFAEVPAARRRIRLEDYVLAYAPPAPG